QIAFHRFSLKEIEIQRHRFIPPFVEMYILLPDVKGQQKSSARTQHAFHLPHRVNERWARNVNDGIEGRNSSERALGDAGQREHIPLLEGYVRVQASRLLDHLR